MEIDFWWESPRNANALGRGETRELEIARDQKLVKRKPE